jgi:hypothetical protein
MEQTKEKAEAMEKGLEEVLLFAERVSEIFDPQWKARIDILKTIITLCSGSIVLTVGFSGSFRSLSVGPFWKQLVMLSFVLLVVSLLLAFIALRFSATVYDLSANVFTMKILVQDAHKESASFNEFLEAFQRIHKDTFHPIKTSDEWAIRLYKACGACFFMAMLLLGVVGFRQLWA